MQYKTISGSQVFPETGFNFKISKTTLRLKEFPGHGHDFTELVIILGGSAKHIYESSEYQVKPGDVFIIKGRETHGFRDCREFRLSNIMFEPEFLTRVFPEIGVLPGYQALLTVEPAFRNRHRFQGRLWLNSEQLQKVEQIIDQLIEEQRKSESGRKIMLTARLAELVIFLTRCYAATENLSKPAESVIKLSATISYIKRHFTENLTLRQLAKRSGMPVNAFLRDFKKITGCSPIEFVLRQRIRTASELLRGSSLRISEIAFRTGFADSNYFTRQFRKINGISPREFRKSV